MTAIAQTWTLTVKNLILVLLRRWFSTPLRAFIFPIVYMFFISYAKNFFIPPSLFGIASPSPILSFPDALQASTGGRDRVVFVDNGHTTGNIASAISQLSSMVTNAGKEAVTVRTASNLTNTCPSTLRGVSQCYGAVNFHSAPDIPGGSWNYTMLADGALGIRIFVNSDQNDAEIYILPFQRAIDSTIANISGYTPLPDTVMQYPFTAQSQAERAAAIVRLYQGTLMHIISVAFFIGICGICYQLVGHMALEREMGMSQLIESMMPNKLRWAPQAIRLAAVHIAFDIIYIPGWIIMGVIVAFLVFPNSSVGLLIGLHLMIGLALCSYSIFFGSFFKRAQLSGITSVIVSLVLAIIAQLAIGPDGSTGTVVVLGLLFPPMTYIFFLIYMAGFQRHSQPTILHQASPVSEWKVSGAAFFVLMTIQIIVFPLLAILVERALYGTSSKTRRMTHNAEPLPVAVRLQNFSKTYQRHWFLKYVLCCGLKRKYKDKVRAVDDLSIDVRSGEIMILLGANGSGKSTTLNSIAGLETISGGSIDIDGTGGLGLCPQKNVMWDLLTVKEHVKIFNRLKSQGSYDENQQLHDLIAACDLDRKVNALAGTLSGGQKRKLQLAMMFTGGSRVCCIDEVSSGIDPLARRRIWDILLAERGKRTILLTTHFLDEADVLSDHIALMSKGKLKAEGSAAGLKHTLGDGYRVNVANEFSYRPSEEFAHVQQDSDYDQTVYGLSDSKEVSRFVNDLELKGVNDYGIQGPTIEDVFMKFATQQMIEDREESDASESDSDSGKAVNKLVQPLDLVTGLGTGLFAQAWILFRKRWTILKRNYLPYVAAFIVPVIAAALTTLFLDGFRPLGCAPDSVINTNEVDSFTSQVTIDLPLGPPGQVPSAQELSLLAPGLINASSLHYVNTVQDFNAYITNNYHNVTPGGFFLGESPVFAYYAEYTVSAALLVQNFVNNLLTQSFANGIGGIISAQFQAFAIPLSQGTGNSLQLVLYTGLALSIAPGFFALYPTAERLRKVRALHYSNGIRAAPIWTAYAAFDFVTSLLICIVIVIIWGAVWPYWYNIGYVFVVLFLYFLAATSLSYICSLFVPSQLAAFAASAGYQCVMFLLYFVSYLAIITYAPPNKIDDWVTIAHFTIGLITPSGNMLRALLLTLNEFSLTCKGYQLASYPGDITVFGGPILYLLMQFLVCMAFLIWYDAGGRFSDLVLLFRRRNKLVDAEYSTSTTDPDAVEEMQRIKTGNDGLRVVHISKSFGQNLAVDDITFGIRKGEVFALLGPNGAGKSTTISLIRGDLRALSNGGDVYVEEMSLSRNRNLARNHLGVCPQFDAIDTMTVAEHLKFYARARGVPDVKHNVSSVMKAVGLTQYRDRLAGKLSGGNKRKLSLAISMMGNPAVLLLDEPSSGMDALAKRVMWRTLESVKSDRALLITTHSMEEADALAQRAGIMASRMLALGTTDALRKRHGDAFHVHLVHKDSPHTSSKEMERVREWIVSNIIGAQVEDRTYHGQLRFSVPNTHLTGLASSSTSSPTSSSALQSPAGETFNGKKDAEPSEVTTREINTKRKQGAGFLFNLLESHKKELGFAYYSVSPTTLDQVFLNVVNRHNVEEENYTRDEKAFKRKRTYNEIMAGIPGAAFFGIGK